MEGLEISIINYSEVLNHTLSSRLDSEFFLKKYLEDDKSIAKNGFSRLVEVTHKINVGFVGVMVKHYCNDGITILQTKNIGSFFISDHDTIKITSQFHNELKKSEIHKNNILIARSGSFGKAAIYLDDEIINSSDIIIVEANERLINPCFLVSYLNSKFGINQMVRFASGGLQGHVNLTILEELEVPKISTFFQEEIEKVLGLAYSQKKQSKQTYTQAENLLLEEIGLQNFEPSQEPVNIKSFANSFGTSGRLDAEYYQKKYDDIDEKLSNKETFKISDVFEIKSNASPKNYLKNGIKVIKTKNIRIPSVTFDKITDHTDSDCYLIEKNDLLFASMGVGSLGRVSFIHDNNVATIDGTIKVLRTRENYKGLHYEIPTLLFLTSKIGIEQIYKYVIGSTGIISISKRNVEGLIIPNITQSKREEITHKILHSIALKKKSEHLLNVAKSAVEIAIEEDEAAALAYIQTEVAEYDF